MYNTEKWAIITKLAKVLGTVQIKIWESPIDSAKSMPSFLQVYDCRPNEGRRNGANTMMGQVRKLIRGGPKGKIIHRGRELLVFRRDGYRGFVFKGEPNLIQGWQSLTEPLDFRSEFVEMQLAATMCIPRPKRVAVLGLGLGTVPRSLAHIYPPVEIDAVEIRPEVLDVAKQFFGLELSERLRVDVADAGEWVLNAPNNSYNAVYVDLFTEKGISATVRDPAFMSHLQRIVRPGGLICFNLIASRRANVLLARKLSEVTRSVWSIRGERKSNLALFGRVGTRVKPEVCLDRAKRIDRLDLLPFRLNVHVRRLERVVIEGLDRL